MFMLLVFEGVCLGLGTTSVVRRKNAHGNLTSPWPRRIGWTLLISTLLFGLFVILINTVFFDATLRHLMNRIEEKTGISVTYDSAEGNYFSGRITFLGLKAIRKDHSTSNFDLKTSHVNTDVDMGSIFSSTIRIESLEISDLEGSFQRVAPPSESRFTSDFEIERFVLDGANIGYEDHSRGEPSVKAHLAVKHMDCQKLRGPLAVFDLLLRSNMDGAIDGIPVAITTQGDATGRTTAWKTGKIPLALVREYVGGPFEWIKSGSVEVDVDDSWRMVSSTEIDMHWKIVLRDIQAEVPSNLPASTKAIAEAFVKYLNEHAKELPIEFNVTINENQFEGTWSLEAAGLSKEIVNAVINELAKTTGVSAQAIRNYCQSMSDRFKKYLDDRRKKK